MELSTFLVGRSNRAMALAAVLGVVSGAAGAGLIAVVSTLLTGDGQATRADLGLFLGLAAVSLAARVGAQVLLVRQSQHAVAELRMKLSRGIVASPLRDMEAVGPARILAALTDDVSAVSDAVAGFPFLIVNLATVLGCLAYMAWLSWSVFALIVLAMVLGVLGYRFLERFALRALGEARRGQDSLFRHFRALTEGTKELLLHRERRLDFFETSLARATSDYRVRISRALSLYAVAGAWAQLLLIAVLGSLVFLVPPEWAHGPATLPSFGLTLLYMVRPMDFILQFLPVLGRARVGLGNLASLGLTLRSADERVEKDAALPSMRFQTLELVGVEHVYGPGDESFRTGPIGLSLSPGEIVFVTGGNGSGKSTLAKLLTGLYAPLAGEIRLDGIVVDASRREWYREHFTAVFSDFHLFDKLYPPPTGLRDGEVSDYLSLLRLDNKVVVDGVQLHDGGLSQGQKKRLALLGAWVEDRPIYLFDEWAADQEPGFREIFYTRILPELKARGKLVIVISHDDRYFGHADRVLRMESGRLLLP